MKLTHKFVQPFIDTLEKELPYKVTITDIDGYIVGTSDPARLNQFHPSAYEILCGRQPIETLEQDEYINLPEAVVLGYGEKIIYNDECIGLIGLIGPPEERKKDIKTVQFVLKLLLDRERAQSELELVAADKNAFIVRLLHGINEQDPWLMKRAALYGISLQVPRYIAAVKVRTSDLADMLPLEAASVRKKVLKLVRKVFRDPDDQIYEAETGEIIVMTCSGGSKVPERRAKAAESAVTALREEIGEKLGLSPVIGVSKECESYLGYAEGYQQALAAIDIGERTEHSGGIYFYERMCLGRIVASFSGEIRPILMDGVIRHLDTSRDENLLNTLEVYFENNMSVSATAKALYIHRNTLQYRFKQIKELTGYDIHRVDDMVQLRLAVVQHQLFPREDKTGTEKHSHLNQ